MNFRCNHAIRRFEISQTNTSRSSFKFVRLCLCNRKHRRIASSAKFWSSIILTGIFRWRLRTLILGGATDFNPSLTTVDSSLGRRSVLGLKIASNQSCAFIERKVRPCPLKEYQQAISETDQEKYVHEQPGQPGWQTAKMHEP